MVESERLVKWLPCVVLFAWLSALANPGFAQLRIVTYNAATDTNPNGDVARAGMSTVLQGIAIEAKNGIQKPIDILSLQETTSSLQGAASVVALLNNLYGAGTYAKSTLVGPTTDGTTEAVISGRRVRASSPERKEYISFRTMSVEPPTPRAKSSVASKIGVRISRKP